MILVYKCHNCNNLFSLPFKVNDRGELKRKFDLIAKCSNCNCENDLIVNKIKAEISICVGFAYGLALLVDIIIGLFLYCFSDFEIKSTNSHWQYYVLLLIFLIPFLIAKVSIENDLKAVRTFNRYYV